MTTKKRLEQEYFEIKNVIRDDWLLFYNNIKPEDLYTIFNKLFLYIKIIETENYNLKKSNEKIKITNESIKKYLSSMSELGIITGKEGKKLRILSNILKKFMKKNQYKKWYSIEKILKKLNTNTLNKKVLKK